MFKNLIGGLIDRALDPKPKKLDDVLPKSSPNIPMPKGVKAPREETGPTIWILIMGIEEGRDLLRGFNTPSSAETAMITAQASIRACHAVLVDDLIQKFEDREAKVRTSKQWRDLCRLYPNAFGERQGVRFNFARLRAFGLDIYFDVINIPHGIDHPNS